MNIGLVREIIFFVLTVLAAIFLIPREIKRLEIKRDKELIKELLKEWGADCERAIVLAMPRAVKNKGLRIKEDGGIVECSDGVSIDEIIRQVWNGIREGEREPEGSAVLVMKSVDEVMLSDEEKKGKKVLLMTDGEYQLEDVFGRERELPKAFISKILNTIYAKLDIFEIFDLKLLPIKELEGAMEHLEFFREKGRIQRYKLRDYADCIARSMEMFGIYLWKLEYRSNKSRKRWNELFKRIIRREGK